MKDKKFLPAEPIFVYESEDRQSHCLCMDHNIFDPSISKESKIS